MGDKSKKGDFKKGHPGGPGRPKHSLEMHMINKLPKDVFYLTISKYLQMDIMELQGFLDDVKTKKVMVLDAYIASLIVKGVQTQDVGILEWLATRSVGKVKDQVEHKVETTVHTEILNHIKQQQDAIKDER